jgi:hypothetical protein
LIGNSNVFKNVFNVFSKKFFGRFFGKQKIPKSLFEKFLKGSFEGF